MSRSGIYDLEYGFIPDDDCPQEPPKPTNADRIRAMTDKELAKAFYDGAHCPMRFSNVVSGVSEYSCHSKDGCYKDGEACWLDWLRKEVDDG